MAYSILPRLLMFSNALLVLLLLCALVALHTYADVIAMLDAPEPLPAARLQQLRQWLGTAVDLTVLLGIGGLCTAAFVSFGLIGKLRKSLYAIESWIRALPRDSNSQGEPSPRLDEIQPLVEALAPIENLLNERAALREESQRARSTVQAAETRLFHALDSISEGFSLYDSDDRLVLSNRRYRELIYPGIGHLIRDGMTFEQTTKVTREHQLVSESVSRPDEWFNERLESHSNPAGPFLQRQTDGRWLQINEKKMLDGSTVAVYEDVSDLMHREEALDTAIHDKDVALAERNAVLDGIDYAVLFMDANLDVRIANRAYREMWNIPASFHPPGTRLNLRDYYQRTRGFYEISDDEWEDFLRPRMDAIRRGVTDPPVSYRADGSVLRRACHVLDDGGRMLTYFDITELTRAEAAQREGRELAEAATAMKSQFVATMSHELRTPLNAIIGLTDMLIEERDDHKADDTDDVLEPLQRITLAGKHLLRLIDDILDLSTMEAGRLSVVNERVDLPSLCEEIGRTIRPLAEANGNRLLVVCDPDTRPIESDSTRLRQVVLNLLSNACKFTHDGEVSLRVSQGENYTELAISDTGIGMDADKLDDYFEPFSQGDSSTRRRYGGAGLGLTISKKICELLGAELSGQSEVGQGTTFLVQLKDKSPEVRDPPM